MELIDRDALIKFLRARQKSVHDRLTHPINWAEAYEDFIRIVENRERVTLVEHLQGSLEECKKW